MNSPLKVWFDAEGHLLRLRLERPKANLIDAAMSPRSMRRSASTPRRGLAAVLIDRRPTFQFRRLGRRAPARSLRPSCSPACMG